MDHIEQYLAHFQTIDLDGLNAIKLMKRFDNKFIFHRDKLEPVLNYLQKGYQILKIDENCAFKYENLYYDTADHFFYLQHHNRKLNRYKLRCRKYIETNQCFFEIKFKNNKGKTIKNRLLLEDSNIRNELSEESKKFAREHVLINNGDIIDLVGPSLWISFNRITFGNLINKERLTFDVNLTYTDKQMNSKKINNLVIAEIKSENTSMNSPFFQYLKSIKIFPSRFSKYCMGIAMMEKDIKHNRFKKKLLKLNKLM
ncbi:MAG: polyphosphate polymerase domain-containing protein [Deltaproteobacteria bacterium]|nr:polyphosphate polymerase domain-containing protein [Deltaproteobacteria bacterium]